MLIPICWKYTEHSPETPPGISQTSQGTKTHTYTNHNTHSHALHSRNAIPCSIKRERNDIFELKEGKK